MTIFKFKPGFNVRGAEVDTTLPLRKTQQPTFTDQGCHLHPSCLTCPRPVCVFDEVDSTSATIVQQFAPFTPGADDVPGHTPRRPAVPHGTRGRKQQDVCKRGHLITVTPDGRKCVICLNAGVRKRYNKRNQRRNND